MNLGEGGSCSFKATKELGNLQLAPLDPVSIALCNAGSALPALVLFKAGLRAVPIEVFDQLEQPAAELRVRALRARRRTPGRLFAQIAGKQIRKRSRLRRFDESKCFLDFRLSAFIKTSCNRVLVNLEDRKSVV